MGPWPCFLAALLAWLPGGARQRQEAEEVEESRRLFRELALFQEGVTLETFLAQRPLASLVAYNHHAAKAAIEILAQDAGWSRQAMAFYVLGETRSSEIFKYLDRPMDSRARVFLLAAILKHGIQDEIGAERKKELQSLVTSAPESLARLTDLATSVPALDQRQVEIRLRYALQQESEGIKQGLGRSELSYPAKIVVDCIGPAALSGLLNTYQTCDTVMQDRILGHLAGIVSRYSETAQIDPASWERILMVATAASVDQNASLRSSALDLLWEFWKHGDTRSELHIRRLVEDPDGSVAGAAKRYLHALTEEGEKRNRRGDSRSSRHTERNDGSTGDLNGNGRQSDASRVRGEGDRRPVPDTRPLFVVAVLAVPAIGGLILLLWVLRRRTTG